jgi:nucleoside phosphorylase
MRVLVTFAVEAEFAPWRTFRAFKKTRINPAHWSGGLDVREAEIGDCSVCVFFTGIGIKSFDFAFASCLKNVGVNLVLSSGLAGSLKAELVPGEIVVPRRVGTLRDASGIAATYGLVARAEQQGATVIDTLLTADRVIATKEEKNRLALFGQAVDMESFHVMSEFIYHSLPVATIRAISDANDKDLPVDFTKCLTSQGGIKVGPLLKELVGHPAKVSDLVRFGRQSRNAAQKLTAFLDRFIHDLTREVLSSSASEVVAT